MATEEKTELVFDDGRIESIEEFQTPGQLYEELITRVRKYHPSADISLIRKAYRVASDAHKGHEKIRRTLYHSSVVRVHYSGGLGTG